MKKSIFLPLLAALALTGCTEDYSQSAELVHVSMEPVANLVATPSFGVVVLSWDLPKNDQYYYSVIKYNDQDGKTVTTRTGKYALDKKDPTRVRAIINGFNDTNEYDFSVTHYSFAGDASATTNVKCSPLDRSEGKTVVLNTVKITPGEECANIEWDNEFGADVTLEVLHLDYYNIKGEVTETTTEFETVLNSEAVLSDLPSEIDITLKYRMRDNESGELSETKEITFQTTGPEWDVYDPDEMYFPVSYYGDINQMTITWDTPQLDSFVVETSGGDPYIYTQIPNKPRGAKLVFRYKSDKNVTGIQIFLNGEGPSEAKSARYTGPDGYGGFRRTNGYWKTIVWDLTGDLAKYDFINGHRKVRFDFGGQSNRTMYFRHMHFEE